PANVKVGFVMTGTDDHGVKDATLHVVRDNDTLLSKNVLEGRPANPEFRAAETLDLAPLKLKPGSLLNYWLTVRDNKEPSPNKIETTRQQIEIIAPVSPKDRKAFEDKQNKEREQLNQAAPPAPEDQQAPEEPPPQGRSDEQNNESNPKGSGDAQSQNAAEKNAQQA